MISIRKYVHILMVTALVLAGVSPACAFISGGKSFIEICAADGSLKTIAIDFDQAPPADKEHQSQGGDCTFCFTSSHLKSSAAAAMVLPAPSSAEKNMDLARISGPHFSGLFAFSPRGPPAFFS